MVALAPVSPPPAPDSAVDDLGAPRFGVYQGWLGRVGFDRLNGPYRRGWLYRLAHAKKWQWVMVSTCDLIAGVAIVDLGYAANAFAFAADLPGRRMLVDESFLGLPRLSVKVGDRPGEGAEATFRGPGASIRFVRAEGSPWYRLGVRTRDLLIDADLDAAAAPPPLVLIAPIPGGTVNATQKANGVPTRGRVECLGRRYVLDGGFGGCDYTNGLLARHTSWRWAFATGNADDGRPVGLDFTHGFNEAAGLSENAVWIGGSLRRIGPIAFEFDPAETLKPWRVRSEDGRVDLVFDPVGQHREGRNLIVARSHFVQALGTFRGTVNAAGAAVKISALPGVCEDQRVTW